MPKYNLKPCPFCGRKAEFRLTQSFFNSAIYVECTNCKCGTKTIEQSIEYTAREKVAEIWNTRVNVISDMNKAETAD